MEIPSWTQASLRNFEGPEAIMPSSLASDPTISTLETDRPQCRCAALLHSSLCHDQHFEDLYLRVKWYQHLLLYKIYIILYILYIYFYLYYFILHIPSLSLHIVKLDLRAPSRPTTSDFDTAELCWAKQDKAGNVCTCRGSWLKPESSGRMEEEWKRQSLSFFASWPQNPMAAMGSHLGPSRRHRQLAAERSGRWWPS